MTDQIFGIGNNIKCHDKLKIQNINMKCRLHTQNKYYRSESHNQIISCHKSRNNTDWFVVRTPNKDDSSPNYIFKNGDIIVLTHGLSNKNIHAAQQYDSPISKQCEVSACMNEDAINCCQEDQWKIQIVQGHDEYWRVGDTVKFVNVKIGKYLCSHKKQLDENKQWQVFVTKPTQDNTNEGDVKNIQWVVCEQQPFIKTAPVQANSNKTKNIEDLSELQQLKQQKRRHSKTKKVITFQQSVQESNQKKMRQLNNQFIRQIEANKLIYRERSCWKKYLCCCFYPEPKTEEGYLQLR